MELVEESLQLLEYILYLAQVRALWSAACGKYLPQSLAELGKSILPLAGEQEYPPTTEDQMLNLLQNQPYPMHPYLPRVRC